MEWSYFFAILSSLLFVWYMPVIFIDVRRISSQPDQASPPLQADEPAVTHGEADLVPFPDESFLAINEYDDDETNF